MVKYKTESQDTQLLGSIPEQVKQLPSQGAQIDPDIKNFTGQGFKHYPLGCL